MNGAIYGRTASSVPKHRRRRLVMSFEMVRLDRASSEPLYQQLYRQIREELESGSFDSTLPVCLPPLSKARRLMQRSRRSIPHSTSKISKPF
jgi:hypothetical protein